MIVTGFRRQGEKNGEKTTRIGEKKKKTEKFFRLFYHMRQKCLFYTKKEKNRKKTLYKRSIY